MSNARILVKLKRVEYSALMKLAERQKRDPCQQAAMHICEGLEREELLQPTPISRRQTRKAHNEESAN